MHANGRILVVYRGNVYFPFGSFLVEVKQQQLEYEDGLGRDDDLSRSYFSKYLHNGGTIAFESTRPLQRTGRSRFTKGCPTAPIGTTIGLNGPMGCRAALHTFARKWQP